MMFKKIQILAFLALFTTSIYAYNLRQLSNRDGLSNSAILSMCQDEKRFMWFGTTDGLNMYDGGRIQIYKPALGQEANSISGNLIEEVFEAEEGVLWVSTNHGLNRLDKLTGTVEYFNQFKGRYFCAKTAGNEIFAVREDRIIQYYHKEKKQFVAAGNIPELVFNQIRHFFIDASNQIWIVRNNGEALIASLNLTEELPEIKITGKQADPNGVLYAFPEKDYVYYIDRERRFFELNVRSGKKILVMELAPEIDANGIVSSIIRDEDDYLIAFQTNGLFRLKNYPDQPVRFRAERIGIYCGVFSLLKDEKQNIIWIGTDGQGVYIYSKDSFSMRSVTFDDLPYRIQKPVRAFFVYRVNNLWFGTKEDGKNKLVEFKEKGNNS